mmetsp:Transcript_15845/g.22064  ORF Transcript_15845/g.22064 Transcript_15845/m.22064 type:complete len:137 (-) Transcript_15845:217-627(-)
MGKLSIDFLIADVDQTIEKYQLETRAKIYALVKRAKTEDPAFFNIPYNPFNWSNNCESDEEDEERTEAEKAELWYNALKASSNPTAKQILFLRNQLFKNVHAALDEFKMTAPNPSITPNGIYGRLYARLLQMEYII